MNTELIKKYLANELSNDERYAFELEMENDPFLRDAVDGFEMAASDNNQWSIDKTEENLHQEIDKKVMEIQSDKKVITMSFFKYAAAACVIGLVALATWRFGFQKNGIDEQALYAANFKPLTHPDGIVRGEYDTTLETKAAEAYEKEDYFGAVNYYQKLVSANPENTKNNLFLAISFMATNQPKKAIDVLSKITASEEFHFDIQWYLALAYLKNKDLPNAQVYFQNTAKEENYYQQQSKAILEKLDGKVAMK
ncbi:MAG: tetratricopeptide repeat protein [Chitinophagales bacterium]